jgi:DNA invertase Pin-like site-specific DNA recombinase
MSADGKDDRKSVIRCAIYTRKSSEEGLEQSFNSLDAQREACQAFITSQRQEGWRVLPEHYDDGGYSGGSMDRPALKRLLADLEANKVDTIVVYKVDRLTRSLTDFAKIVEALDARGVSFVSVTQQFNTTTSMGRLTLNVLLSFAQFEREVTGERIRDKIAASKRKGMWMGGRVPLGYDLEGRKLVPNQQEAEVVNKIFRLYLALGCVFKLKKRLDEEGIKSKLWVTRSGPKAGGSSLARGALYHLLRNRIYLGEISHRRASYPGQHQAIVPRELWEKVQAHLSDHNQGRKNGLDGRSTNLLTGLIKDAEGTCFTPSHAVKTGKRYRYYVSQSAIRNPGVQHSGPVRLPAHDIEKLVTARLRSFLQSENELIDQLTDPEDRTDAEKLLKGAKKLSENFPSISAKDLHRLVRNVVHRVTIHDSSVELLLNRTALRQELAVTQEGKQPSNHSCPAAENLIRLQIPANLKRCGLEMRLIVAPESKLILSRVEPSLLKALAKAHEWYGWILAGEATGPTSIAQRIGLDETYVGKVLRCAFVAPDIVEAIIDGRQPRDLTFKKLSNRLPMSWMEQRKQLGFA